MKPKKKKIIKIAGLLVLVVLGLATGGSIYFYSLLKRPASSKTNKQSSARPIH